MHDSGHFSKSGSTIHNLKSFKVYDVVPYYTPILHYLFSASGVAHERVQSTVFYVSIRYNIRV